MIDYLIKHYNLKVIPTAIGTTCPSSSRTNLSHALQPVQCPGTINCGLNSLKHLTVSSIIAESKCKSVLLGISLNKPKSNSCYTES